MWMVLEEYYYVIPNSKEYEVIRHMIKIPLDTPKCYFVRHEIYRYPVLKVINKKNFNVR